MNLEGLEKGIWHKFVNESIGVHNVWNEPDHDGYKSVHDYKPAIERMIQGHNERFGNIWNWDLITKDYLAKSHADMGIMYNDSFIYVNFTVMDMEEHLCDIWKQVWILNFNKTGGGSTRTIIKQGILETKRALLGLKKRYGTSWKVRLATPTPLSKEALEFWYHEDYEDSYNFALEQGIITTFEDNWTVYGLM